MPHGRAPSNVVALPVLLRTSSVFRRIVAPLGVLAALSVAPGGSAQADPLAVIAGEALDVKADRLEVDIDKGTAQLAGHVRVTMGELEVWAPAVGIQYDQAPRVKWARATDGVKARVKGIEATAQSVEVDVAKRRVKLSGGVRLTRGKGWLKAERASIDLATRKVTLDEVSGSIPVETPRR